MKRHLAMAMTLYSFSPGVHAYNLEAHGFMTNISFDRSDLATTDLLQRLGLDRLETNYPFNNQAASCQTGTGSLLYNRDAYIDANGFWSPGTAASVLNNQFVRCPTLFEQRSSLSKPSKLLFQFGAAHHGARSCRH
jgi:hypothetical protein